MTRRPSSYDSDLVPFGSGSEGPSLVTIIHSTHLLAGAIVGILCYKAVTVLACWRLPLALLFHLLVSPEMTEVGPTQETALTVYLFSDIKRHVRSACEVARWWSAIANWTGRRGLVRC